MENKARAFLILTAIMALASVSATANPAYTDDHLSRSTELMLMERSYDLGLRDGKKLRRDQVVVLQSSNDRLEQAVGNLGERVNDLSSQSTTILRASEGVLGEANNVNQHSKYLASTSGRVLEDAIAVNERESYLENTVATADNVLRTAEQEAAAMRERAAMEAHEMVVAAKKRAHDEYADPNKVMNESVSCDLINADVRQVISCLNPEGWEFRTDIDNQMFINSKIGFTSDSARSKAIREFVSAVRQQTNSKVILNVNFYPGIVDEEGNPRPLMVVSEERK